MIIVSSWWVWIRAIWLIVRKPINFSVHCPNLHTLHILISLRMRNSWKLTWTSYPYTCHFSISWLDSVSITMIWITERWCSFWKVFHWCPNWITCQLRVMPLMIASYTPYARHWRIHLVCTLLILILIRWNLQLLRELDCSRWRISSNNFINRRMILRLRKVTLLLIWSPNKIGR